MNTQKFGGAALVTVRAFQHAFDEALFEFSHCFIEQNSTLHHLPDKPFQLISHVPLSARANFRLGRVRHPIRAQPECGMLPGIWHV